MAGIRGNQAWWAFKAQSAQGTAAKLEAEKEKSDESAEKQVGFKVPFSGGDLSVNRQFGNLSETDESRSQGVSYAKVGGLQGSPEAYARGNSLAALLFYALGEDTPSGATTKRIHKIKPAAALPYVTVWKMIGGTGVFVEEYIDCIWSGLSLKTTAGEPLTAASTILGRKTTFSQTDPSKESTHVTPLESEYVYNYNDALVKLEGSETRKVSSFDLTINNNAVAQQTDDFSPIDVAVGQVQIELSFDIIIDSTTAIEEYRKFNYGTTSGTAESNTLQTAEMEFEFKHDADHLLKFKFAKVAYESYPISPNTTGAPVVASVKGVVQRNTPLMEATVNNEVAKYT